MILKRFRLPLGEQLLPEALREPDSFPTERVGERELELQPFLDTFARLRDEGVPPAKWDRELAIELHLMLKDSVDRRTLLDARVWHWLCVVPLRDFVWARWGSGPSSEMGAHLTSSLAERFLGAASLRGFSRNALARLYWCAETLWTHEDGYDLVQEALSNQDFFQAIFERELGLHPPAAVACLRALKRKSESERRTAVKRLNHYLTTIVVETLTTRQIQELLDSRPAMGDV